MAKRKVSEMKVIAKEYDIIDKNVFKTNMPSTVITIKSDKSEIMLNKFIKDRVPIAAINIKNTESSRVVYQRVYQYLTHHKHIDSFDDIRVTMIEGGITLINKRLMSY